MMVATMTNPFTHTPVLLRESLEMLRVRPGGTYIDATVGLGGHSEAIAVAMGADGRLLAIDQDSDALEFARKRLARFGSSVSLFRGNFAEIGAIAAAENFFQVDGVLMDLGISSLHIQDAERGFAISLDGPLDMRMNRNSDGPTAAEIVNEWDEEELANLFYRLGEERQSRRIARAVVAARPLRTTRDLAKAAEQAVGNARSRTHIHPATKVFLALRIAVNSELDSLDAALPQACRLLGFGTGHGDGGRLAVISFHSLEDRIVKQYIRREARDCICPPGLPVCTCGHRATLRDLARKAIRPGAAEVADNPRSRSAVLRAAERIA